MTCSKIEHIPKISEIFTVFFIFQILNLPGRRKINFQLFTIIAALSEKISQME
jgi:hypothetical protein